MAPWQEEAPVNKKQGFYTLLLIFLVELCTAATSNDFERCRKEETMYEVDDFDFEDYFLEVEDEDDELIVPEGADALEEDGQFDRLW